MLAAARAFPGANVERQFSKLVTAVRTRLGRGFPLVELDEVPPRALGLIGHLGREAMPARIRDCPRQTAVLEPVADPQRLHNDRLVFVDQSLR